jgi:hypothetical protein
LPFAGSHAPTGYHSRENTASSPGVAMSWNIWLALLLVVGVLGALLTKLAATTPERRAHGGRLAIVFGVLAALVLALGSFTMVSTRNVGVVTTFGKPTGTLSNGLHIKAPWQSVTEMNGTIQIDNHTGELATTVRLGNNSVANVENSVRWRIVPAAADELFRRVVLVIGGPAVAA